LWHIVSSNQRRETLEEENTEGNIQRLRSCKAFLLDMDGTIFVGETLIPGARELVSHLSEQGIPHLFLTNNSSCTGERYRARLERMGIPATRDQVLTSGDATAAFLLDETEHRSVYLLGTPDLEATFKEEGLRLDAENPDCVVVGFDRTLTYEKLNIACRYLFAGKPYYATHPDRTCITSDGLIPDIAAIIAALEAVTHRTPIIIGKPYPFMVHAALQRLNSTAQETAIVGDQLDTDMTMARQSKLCGVLVMTGETSASQVAASEPSSAPTLIAQSVVEVLDWLR
jgi:HAD superfamily hydrolase (TIGR01457 family)